MSEYDVFDVLKGRIKPPRPMPCINADLTVVAWSRERGVYETGRGTDIRFDQPIKVLATLGAALGR